LRRLLEMNRSEAARASAVLPGGCDERPAETFYVAEMIREKVFHLTREEGCRTPSRSGSRSSRNASIRVPVRQGDRFRRAGVAEGILIGKGGAMLKRIGTAARHDLESFFGIKVFLQSKVEVRRHWRRDERRSASSDFG